MLGFLPVDKTGGITSHDVVDRVRRETGVRKVGHAGTLDPMATGLVVCGIGAATRLMRYIQDLPKTYLAEAQFGVGTDTLDADGSVIHEDEVVVERPQIGDVIPRFIGVIEQVPPMVSAVKVGGERLYEKARRGEVVERAPRTVTVTTFELEDLQSGIRASARFRIECGKGTYIRTLVDDLAQTLGTRAHLTGLRRTKIGTFTIDDAVAADLEGWEEALISPTDGLAHLQHIVVGEESGVRNGRPVEASGDADAPLAMVDTEGTLLAVYRMSTDGLARPEVVLPR